MTARDFAIQLDREWAEKVEDINEFVALVGLTAIRGVVLKSPVDTGRFKGNWNLGVGEADESINLNQFDKSGGETITRADGSLQAYAAFENFPVIHITNNLPYAGRLEDGYSGQAPGGMVGLTVAEIEAQFDGETI